MGKSIQRSGASRFLRKWYQSIPLIRRINEIQHDLREVNQKLVGVEAVRLEIELQQHPRYGDPRRLLRYGAQVCSQGSEDGVIHEIFRRIGVTNRFFVEAGAGDGIENNTAFLLAQGWQGAWIDGDPRFLETLRDRPDLLAALKTKVTFINRENIAGLLRELGVPQEFDLLSLDIDQNTYYIWEGLQEFRPRVVVIEYNSAIPADVDWRVNYDPARTWNLTQNFGASLKALEKLGRRMGYSLVGCDFVGTNAFFVQDQLLGNQFAEPFTAENHHEPPRIAMLHRRYQAPGLLDRNAG